MVVKHRCRASYTNRSRNMETNSPEEEKRQFFLDEEDDAFQQDLVSIGPYDERDRLIIDHRRINWHASPGEDEEAVRLATIDPASIRMIEGLIPGDCHDLGYLGRGNEGAAFGINSNVYPFGHALCFRLLSGFVPLLMNPVGNFWAVVRAQNGIKYTRMINGIDYGDIEPALDQFVWPFHGYDYDEEDLDRLDIPPKIKLALRKNPLDPADLHDYWFTTGKVYVWKRPDRLEPVSRSLSRLSEVDVAYIQVSDP